MSNNLFLLLYFPRDKFERRIIKARFDRYLTHSQKNSPLLLLASLMISAFHLYVSTPLLALAAWQLGFAIIVTIIYSMDSQQRQNFGFRNMRKMVIRRSAVSMILAVFLGGSIFLLPRDVAIQFTMLYIIVLVCIFGVILISNVIFPEYYICYGFILLTLPLLHAVYYTENLGDAFVSAAVVLYLTGPVIMFRKAIDMSRIAINEITFGLILKDQMKEMLELHQVISHQSLHDELTGLANRRKFEVTADAYQERAKSHGSIFGVIYVDLDKFKPINDTHGHKYGDWVLQEMANRIKSNTRETDLACRMGGDEFCVLLQHVSGRPELDKLTAVLKERLQLPFAIDGIDLTLGASMGSAIYPADGNNVDELVTSADHRMYQQKNDAVADNNTTTQWKEETERRIDSKT